jgi:hypothetical protein
MRNAYAMNNYAEAKEVAENLPATGKDQSQRCPEPGGRAGRNADGASLGYRSGVAAETGFDSAGLTLP